MICSKNTGEIGMIIDRTDGDWTPAGGTGGAGHFEHRHLLNESTIRTIEYFLSSEGAAIVKTQDDGSIDVLYATSSKHAGGVTNSDYTPKGGTGGIGNLSSEDTTYAIEHDKNTEEIRIVIDRTNGDSTPEGGTGGAGHFEHSYLLGESTIRTIEYLLLREGAAIVEMQDNGSITVKKHLN